MILLSDYLNSSLIKTSLCATDKISAIDELISLIITNNPAYDRASLLNSVIDRELSHHTYIGHHIAIPHTKTALVEKIIIAIGIAKNPINKWSEENQHIKLVVLVLSPITEITKHIQTLATLAKKISDEKIFNAIIESNDVADIFKLVSSTD